MYIFMCDASADAALVHKGLYSFYSDVLSNIDVDSLTNREVNLELKKREIGKFIKKGSMVLIFKKL